MNQDPDANDVDSEQAYDQWLRAKIVAALADPRPSIPHPEAMARIRANLDAIIAQRLAGRGKGA
jgi:hypothetical protein